MRRDVDRLRELGYPVRATKGPDGGYRLDAGADLPPLLFDDEQAVAVAVALQTATTSVAGIEEGALRALATVRQVMPARLRQRVDALQVTAVPRTAVDAAEGRHRAPDRDRHRGAGPRGAAVRLRRTRTGPARSERGSRRAEVEPHHLVTWGGRWYLVAWDLDRKDWRTFRVDRMTPKTPTGPRFTPRELPAPDVATYIARGSAARVAVPGEVVLHAPAADMAPGSAAGASSRSWHRPLPGGRRVVVMGRGWPPGSACSSRHRDRRAGRAAGRGRRPRPPVRRGHRRLTGPAAP